jgi:hypothetical protein
MPNADVILWATIARYMEILRKMHPDNVEYGKLWNSILNDMSALRISHMVCSHVMGKYPLSAIKCALEALDARREFIAEPDEQLLRVLEGKVIIEAKEPILLPEKRPPTVVGKTVPSPLETMALLNQICKKSTKEEGLKQLKALRESLAKPLAEDSKNNNMWSEEAKRRREEYLRRTNS